MVCDLGTPRCLTPYSGGETSRAVRSNESRAMNEGRLGCFSCFRMQKAFLNFVVAPTFDLVKDIAPKTHRVARGHIAANLDRWTQIAATGDRTRVLNQDDPERPAERLHASPAQSPFHSSNQASWCAICCVQPCVHHTMWTAALCTRVASEACWSER